MLIALCCWDTLENNRYDCTRRTLESLRLMVNLTRHRVVVTDNASPDNRTVQLLEECRSWLSVVRMTENYGTARAVNRAWELRKDGEHCVKMDNDVVVHVKDWPDIMEDVFDRDPTIGICGLKRDDLMERPDHPDASLRSTLWFLPNNGKQRWRVVEEVNHVMGTCQAYSAPLLKKIGYLDQGTSLYGFDDCLSSERAHLAGFKTVLLPGIDIDHIDNVEPNYTQWKQAHAGAGFGPFAQAVEALRSGKRPLYCPVEGMTW